MINYQKYSGAGNKFLIADAVNNNITSDPHSIIKLMCEPDNKDLDGVIYVEKSSHADFKMHYYNRDGTGNALCGNGLRCTARFIRDNGLSNKDILALEAVGNVYVCFFNIDGTIKVDFPPPAIVNPAISLKVHFSGWWQDIRCAYVNVGSPHIVIFTDDIKKPSISSLEDIDIEEWGRNVRLHKDLMPEGANVNFAKVTDKEKNEIEIRSYERGVEGETLACGTGALSSAIIAYITRGQDHPIKVLTRSGEYLVVDLEERDGKIISMSLAGPAVRIDNN